MKTRAYNDKERQAVVRLLMPFDTTIEEWVNQIGKDAARSELKKLLHRIERLIKKAVLVGDEEKIITAYSKYK